MGLFQYSVLRNALVFQDPEAFEKAYKKFQKYFHNPEIQFNIREAKEEQFQEGFLRELFVNVLGYTINPDPRYNLSTEFKNQTGNRKADAALLKDGKAVAVIELKGSKIKDLESIRRQAFDYKNNQPDCRYVVTSNFEKLRFYIDDSTDFEDFNLFTLSKERFAVLYLCLQKDLLLVRDMAGQTKDLSRIKEEEITNSLYEDYSLFKRELFRDLVKENRQNPVFRSEFEKAESEERAEKNIKLALFKKSQKLLDRLFFLFFAEGRGLLKANTTSEILKAWHTMHHFGSPQTVYELLRKQFDFMDGGRKEDQHSEAIFAYNGGLFKADPLLDSLVVSDKLLLKYIEKFNRYNFDSEVDVTIMGHIFEHSLNEMESVNAAIEGVEFDEQKSKRKKDGIFYTPDYITKYMVNNTIGKWCEEQKNELEIREEDYFRNRKGRPAAEAEELENRLEMYRERLFSVRILDPACGSGAFLNQALSFLIEEHNYLNELQARISGKMPDFENLENQILEANIFGVDLNEESVEITKLSLWLRTAQPRKKLSFLEANIKCGNSLIDSKSVAGYKAFKWENEFPEIIRLKDKKAFHITTATHDSRTSERMIEHKVREKRDGGSRPNPEPVCLEPADERLIAETVAEIIRKDRLNVLAFNICGDHLHLLLVCEEAELSQIVGKIKAVSSRKYNISRGITIPATTPTTTPTRGHVPLQEPQQPTRTRAEVPLQLPQPTREQVPLQKLPQTRGHVPLPKQENKKVYNSLWTQKFGNEPIKDKKHLLNTIEYIRTNREKHELPALTTDDFDYEKLLAETCCDSEKAFRPEYAGGFDFVLGNPPYVSYQSNVLKPAELAFFNKKYESVYKIFDLYGLFIERIDALLNKQSDFSFICPSPLLMNDSFSKLRSFIAKNFRVKNIVFCADGVFEGAVVPTIIFIFSKGRKENEVVDIHTVKNFKYDLKKQIPYEFFVKNPEEGFNVGLDENSFEIIRKLTNRSVKLGEILDIRESVKTGNDKFFISDKKLDENYYPLVTGKDVSRYFISQKRYLLFDNEALSRPTKLEYYQQEKLFIRRVGSKVECVYDDKNNLSTHVLYIASLKGEDFELKYLMCLLNSNLFTKIYHLKYPPKGKVFPEIRIGNLREFDIKKIPLSAQKPFEEKADKMLSLNKEREEIRAGFLEELELEKIPRKLQNFEELSLPVFAVELAKAKAIKFKDKAEEADFKQNWKKLFERESQKIAALSAEIAQTDQEIDRMVYALYELSEEEIALVEAG